MADGDGMARYALSGGLGEAVALDDELLEDRVEHKWYSPEIPRAKLKELMKRSDGLAWLNYGPWVVLLVASGYVGAVTWGTWWAVPAFFVYGTLYSSTDARWHEGAHGTAFRTRWINEIFYHVTSFMTLREGFFWRWSHSRHHTETYIVGRDMEIQVPRPANLFRLVCDFFFIFGGLPELKRTAQHALGIVTPAMREFVPEHERYKVFWSARVEFLIVGATVVWAIAIGSFLPIMYIWTPRFYCGWHHQLVGLVQHAGLAENVRDHRLNTRTVYMNPVWRFLYLDMNYHLEHHMFPMVPFYRLADLHEAIKDQTPPAYPSTWAAYREMIPALFRQARGEPNYVIPRPIPAARSATA